MNRTSAAWEVTSPLEESQKGENFRIVARDVGALQVVIGAAMLLPLGVSLLYGELYTALAFLAASAVTAGSGAAAYRRFRRAGEPERRHAMLTAGGGWLVTGVFGSLPFLLTAWLTPDAVAQTFVPEGESYVSSLRHFANPLHAFFESMSGYTTTGLTMSVHEPSIGHGLLFYRSLTQWIGGAGVIVLALAIMPRPRAVGGLELYQSETTGMKLRPSIVGTVRAIWKIYGAMTVGVSVYLFLATLVVLPDYGIGRALFDSINHALTGLSTGGFSTLDDSIAGYGSLAMDLIYLPPMIMGAIAFPLYYKFFRQRDPRVFPRDPQFRSMMLVFAVSIPLMALFLTRTPAVADPLREGVFQVVSGVTGTGWQTSSIGDWGSAAVLLLAVGGMIVSGSAGSTVGGIKLIRAYVLARGVSWRMRKVFLPNEAVVPFRLGERNLPASAMQREITDAALFSFLYLVILAASVIIVAYLADPQFTLADVIFECISAQSTVGLSTGITDPGMPPAIEGLFIFQMWVGRLEIFPVLVLLRQLFKWAVRR